MVFAINWNKNENYFWLTKRGDSNFVIVNCNIKNGGNYTAIFYFDFNDQIFLLSNHVGQTINYPVPTYHVSVLMYHRVECVHHHGQP